MSFRLRMTLYWGFITIGIVACITSPLLTSIRSDIPMSYGQSGLLLSGQCIGIFITMFLGGFLANRYGKKKFLSIGAFILSFGLLGSSFTNNFTLLFLFTIVIGVGFGTFQIGMNSLCYEESSSNKANAMNYLHFFYGIGSVIGPVLVTICLYLFQSWRSVFLTCTLLPLVFALLVHKLETKNIAPQKETAQKKLYTSYYLILSGLLIFTYSSIESSFQGWLPTYWEKNFQGFIIPATLISSLFWFSLTFGRLVAGKIADHFGLNRYIKISSLLIMFFCFIWFVNNSFIITFILIFLFGFCLSGLYPIIVTSTIEYQPAFSASITAYLTIFSSLGAIVVPYEIGNITDRYSISILPAVLFVASAILVFFCLIRRKKL